MIFANNRLRNRIPIIGSRRGVPARADVKTTSSCSPSCLIHLIVLGHSQRFLTHLSGIPAGPTAAPIIPPRMAAVVSVSPPHPIISRMAFLKSLGFTSQRSPVCFGVCVGDYGCGFNKLLKPGLIIAIANANDGGPHGRTVAG